MTMNLATIEQDKRSGDLVTVALRNIDMSGVGGLWIPCAGSLSPWNTHLGSEEYEPDARCVVETSCASGDIGLGSMNRYLDPSGATRPAKVYDYGLVPEVTVDRHGNSSVVKHRTLGRISREIVQMMPDQRTAFQGDDGTYNVLTMFVADKPADLSSGTLYAAKWNQTSDNTTPGGEATLTWYRLGHATDAGIGAMVEGGIRFDDLFEVSAVADPANCFRTVKAGHTKGLVEHLKLKPGMDNTAAFLETRRYAAYVGATTEFEKFEGVTVNADDGKVYLAMTRMRDGMEDRPGDPANHIRIPKLIAGAVYEMDLSARQKDTDGKAIESHYVGTAMRALVLGEDSSTPHINNFLWAYNVDTRKLSRILSLPAGAESTGLQAIDDLNGFAYILSNFQHAGDFSPNIEPALKAQLDPLIDRSEAAIGYLGGIPGLRSADGKNGTERRRVARRHSIQ